MGTGRERRLDSPDASARRYARALREGRSQPRSDGDLRSQVNAYRRAREREQARAVAVREFLSRRGVHLVQYATYLNFARHVDKVCRNYGAKSREMLVELAVGRWTAYGLARELLLEMYQTLFAPSEPDYQTWDPEAR